MRQKERRAAIRLNASNGQFRIDYAAAMVTQEASSEIERMLSKGAAIEPTPPAPAARRSAAEALKDTRG